MVVDQNQGCRVPRERVLDDLSRMDTRAVDRAPEELLEGDHAVSIVEIDHAENLVRQIAQPRPQEFACRSRVRERRADHHELLIVPTRQLEGGLKRGISGRTKSPASTHSVSLRCEEAAQGAELDEERTRHFEGALTASAGAEQNGQQLGFCQGRSAGRK